MTESFPVILFYKYVEVVLPHAFAAAQRELSAELGLKGRVLIATEGINGTLADPSGAIGKYSEGSGETRALAMSRSSEVRARPTRFRSAVGPGGDCDYDYMWCGIFFAFFARSFAEEAPCRFGVAGVVPWM